MLRLLRAGAAAAVALGSLACASAAAPTPSPKAELILGLAPTRGGDAQVAAAEQLAGLLSGLVKVPVTVRAEPSAAALGDELAAGRIDLAWSDSETYLALRRRHAFTPVVAGARCPPTYTADAPAAGCTPRPGTAAIVVCGTGATVPELANGGDWGNLKGRRFAFQDPSSLAGYIWPRYYLARNHVDPDQDLTKGPPTPSDAAVALAVYNGLADCGALAGDGRQAAAQFAPDIFERTKVVFVAPANIPGDTVFTGSRLNPAQARKLRDGLLRLGILPAASAAIGQLSGGDTHLLAASDRGYDVMRAAIAAVNPKVLDQALPPAPTPSPTRR